MKLEKILEKWGNAGQEGRGWALAKCDDEFYMVVSWPERSNFGNIEAAHAAADAGVPLYSRSELPGTLKIFHGIIKDEDGINLEHAGDFLHRLGGVRGRYDLSAGKKKITSGDELER